MSSIKAVKTDHSLVLPLKIHLKYYCPSGGQEAICAFVSYLDQLKSETN